MDKNKKFQSLDDAELENVGGGISINKDIHESCKKDAIGTVGSIEEIESEKEKIAKDIGCSIGLDVIDSLLKNW